MKNELNGQKGAIAVVIPIVIVVGVFIIGSLFMVLIGGSSNSASGSTDPTENEADLDAITPMPVGDCIFYYTRRTQRMCDDVGTQMFQQQNIGMAKSLGMDGNLFLAAYRQECSLMCNPYNPQGPAAGLIQFTRTGCQNLGCSPQMFMGMPASRQLVWVKKYMAANGCHSGRCTTAWDVYNAIFAPACVGKAANYPVYAIGGTRHCSAGRQCYQKNRGLDRNNDGQISCREVGAAIDDDYKLGLRSCGINK